MISTESPLLVNFFQDFSLWTKIHYYAFVNRNNYPNLFFFHFPYSGVLVKEMTEEERKTIFTFMSTNKSMINGMWGYISLLSNNKNGFEIYQTISKTEFFESSISFPCFQERTCDFDSKLKEKAEKILNDNNEKYEAVLNNYEKYLNDCAKEKQIEYREFNKNNKDIILFAYDQKDIFALMKEKIEKKEIVGNGIILNNKEEDKMQIDDSSINEKSTQIISPKKRIQKKKVYQSDIESDSDKSDKDYKPPNKEIIKQRNLFIDDEVDCLEHEQKLDGYASDYTKKVYVKVKYKDCFSDDEKIKMKDKRKKKVYRVKMKGKTKIKNKELNHKGDKENIGIDFEIEDQYDKLKRDLMVHKTYRKRRKKREKKEKEKEKKKNIEEEEMAKSIITNTKKTITEDYYFYSSSKKSKKKNIMNNVSNISDDNKSSFSFNSLLNGNFPKEKKRGKRTRSTKSNDNMRNQLIQNYIPVVNNLSLTKEKQIVLNINKLISNVKFNSLLYLFEFKRKVIERLTQSIRATTQHFITESNDIDQELLNTYRTEKGEYKLNDDVIIDDLSLKDNDIVKVMKLYHIKINEFFSFLFDFGEQKENTLISLKLNEHLMKIIVQQINTDTMSVQSKAELANSISDTLDNIMTILITYILDSHLSNDTSIQISFLVIYTFIAINMVIIQKINDSQIKTLILKFIKLFNFFLLIKLYSFSDSSLESQTNEEFPHIIALFNLFSEMYYEITNQKNISYSYEMIKMLFNEYIFIKEDIDTQSIGSLNEMILNDLNKFLSPTVNCLFQNKFEDGVKLNLKKYFLYKNFDLDNLSDISLDLKKIIKNKILLMLFYRYFLTMFLFSYNYGKVETSFLQYFDEILKKCYAQSFVNENYYDIDYLSKLISEMKQFKQNYEKGLLEKYLLNDSRLLLLIDNNWSLETQQKLKIIFDFFSIINFQNRKNNVIAPNIIKKEIFKLIPMIFGFSKINNHDELISSFPPLIQFIHNITLCVSNSFSKTEVDEKNKMKFFSRYFSLANPYKNNINERKDIHFSLSIIPVIAIILNYVQFADQFTEKNHIETVISKIKDIIDSEKARSVMKSFSLAIWINLIQKISQKQIGIDISKYMDMINSNIHSVIEKHKIYESLPDYQKEKNILYDENNETISSFLQNFKVIADKNPEIIFTYTDILIEMKEILNIDIFYRIQFRHYIIEIIDILLNKLEENIQKEFACEGELDLGDGEIIMACFENELSDTIELSKSQKDFLIFIRNHYFPLFDKITNFFVSKYNCNISNKKKIFFTYYDKVCQLQAKLYGILTKYNLYYKPFDYCIKVFKEGFYFKTNITKGIIIPSDNENFTKMPFILMSEYLKANRNLIKNQIIKREYKSTIQYFIILFFIGAFMKNDKKFLLNHNLFKQYYMSLTKTENFCTLFLDLIRESKSNIDQSFFYLKSEIQNNNNIFTERNREEASYYNLLRLLISVDTKNYSSITIMSNILDNITIEKNIDKIESRFFFGLLNNEIFSNGLEKIVHVISTEDERNEVINAMMYLKMYILGKYTNDYTIGNCDSNLRIFLDNFIKDLNNEKGKIERCICNETFMMYFNKLLIEQKGENGQFGHFEEQRRLIRNVYSLLLSKCESIDFIQINYETYQIHIIEEKIQTLLSNDFYLILLNYTRQLDTIPNKKSILTFQLILLSSLINKSKESEIEQYVIELLSKIDISNGMISSVEDFLLYRVFIEKLILVSKLIKYPSNAFMEYLQKITEYFIYYFYCIFTNNESKTKIDQIILNKFHNKWMMINYSNDNLQTKFSDYIDKNKTLYIEICEMNNYLLYLLKHYQLINSFQYDRVLLLERVNGIIKTYMTKKLKKRKKE